MSRKPRYPEPPPELVAEMQRVVSSLTDVATGKVAMCHEAFLDLVGPLLRLNLGGQFYGEQIPPVSHFPAFNPHLETALRGKNDPLVACLTLALYLIYQFEKHMPDYAKLIRSKQQTARASAEKRRDEGHNTMTLVEAWERENDRPLTPRDKTHIASCAAAIGRSEITVLDALRRRVRENLH
jgi:hypothetical protein